MSAVSDVKGESRSEGSGAANLDADLMRFRTAWLRAVAYCWASADGDQHARELQSNPKAFLKTKFQFSWPWESVIDFKVQLDQGLRWAGDDWVWPSDREDSLIVKLPISNAPPEASRALALATYYAQRPSIFGTPAGGGSNLRSSAGSEVGAGSSGGSIRFAGTKPPVDGFTPSSGGFSDFSVVLVSALAKAWNNETFADLIRSDSKKLMAALQSIRGYVSPWQLILKVEDDREASWDAKAMKWTNLAPHVIALNLPDRPKAVGEQGVALATYNGTGAEYPFTCCA